MFAKLISWVLHGRNKEVIPHSVAIGSPLYVALHEAGHAALALGFGGVVEKMELFAGPPYSGRTLVAFSSPEQSVIFSLGGYVVEQLLFEAGFATTRGRAIISERAFRSEQEANAAVDLERFAKNVPPSVDRSFEGFVEAASAVRSAIDLKAIWPLAVELAKKRSLGQADIAKLLSRQMLS